MKVLKQGKNVIDCPVCESTLLWEESDVCQKVQGYRGKGGPFEDWWLECPICGTKFRTKDKYYTEKYC